MAQKEPGNLSSNELCALDEIKKTVTDRFEIVSFILFGSTVHGQRDEESDIDILILTKKKLERPVRHEITDIIFEVNLHYSTNFSSLVVDKDTWDRGIISILPIHEDISAHGVPV